MYSGKKPKCAFLTKQLLNFSLANKKEPYNNFTFSLIYDLGKVGWNKGKPADHHKANDLHS